MPVTIAVDHPIRIPRKVMKLIDPSTGLMECRVCGSCHVASLQSGLERADGVTRYFRGSWQCRNEPCPSNARKRA
jgi:hypothetical protein